MSIAVEIRQLIEDGALADARALLDSAGRKDLGPHERDQLELRLKPLEAAEVEAKAAAAKARRAARRQAKADEGTEETEANEPEEEDHSGLMLPPFPNSFLSDTEQ